MTEESKISVKPVELPEYERRDPHNPWCPKWCPYSCTEAWKTGNCLIRTPESNQALTDPYNGRDCAECEIGGCEK